MAIESQTAACMKVLFLVSEIQSTVATPGFLGNYTSVLQSCATALSVPFPSYNAGSPTATDAALGQLLLDLKAAANTKLTQSI